MIVERRTGLLFVFACLNARRGMFKFLTQKNQRKITCPEFPLLFSSNAMNEFKLKPWNRGISDDELLADLRRVAGILGKTTVLYAEYPGHGRCASRIFETRFGSWNEALRAAGLEVGRRQDISDLDLFENMERAWTLLGRQPRREEMKRPISAFSKGTYERRFGGWRNALEAFALFASREPLSDFENRTPPRQVAAPRFPGLRMRWRVLNRDFFRCCSCGRSPATEHGVILHIDHIVAWSKGGVTNEENLQTLCERCNLGKSDT